MIIITLHTRHESLYLLNKKNRNLFLLIKALFRQYKITHLIITINIVIIMNIINIKEGLISDIIFYKDAKVSTIKKINYYYN